MDWRHASHARDVRDVLDIRDARGFTLIEVMVAMALVAMMVAGAVVGLRSLAKSDLRATASHMAGAIRYLFDRASTTGRVHRLHRLNDAEMAAALATRARARGATVGDDLVPWMLTHLPRDMGRLAAAIDALDGYALARRRPLNAALLREWLAAGQP